MIGMGTGNPQDALLVDQVVTGNGLDSESGREDRPGIAGERPSHALLRGRGLHAQLRIAPLDVYAEHHEVVRVGVVKSVDLGQTFHARPTPRGPHVDQDDLALQSGPGLALRAGPVDQGIERRRSLPLEGVPRTPLLGIGGESPLDGNHDRLLVLGRRTLGHRAGRRRVVLKRGIGHPESIEAETEQGQTDQGGARRVDGLHVGAGQVGNEPIISPWRRPPGVHRRDPRPLRRVLPSWST